MFEWIATHLWVIAVVLTALAALFWLRYQRSTLVTNNFVPRVIGRRLVLAWAATLAAVFFWAMFVWQSNSALDRQNDPGSTSPNPSASTQPTESESPTPSAEPSDEPYDPENDFPLIDIDEIRRDDFRAEFPDHEFNGNSLWDRGHERIAAIKAAMKAAGKENLIINDRDTGKPSVHAMGDAVNFPITKLTEKLSAIQSGKLSEEELEALYAEVMHDLEVEIIKNPTMGEMFLQGFAKSSSIMKLNGDAINEMLQMFEDARAKADDPIGLSYWLRGDPKNPTKIYTSDEYVDVIARYVIITLRHCEASGITVRTSTHNWALKTDGNTKDNTINALAYTEEADYQESQEALLVVFYGKEAERVAMGINIWDQRLEIYEPTQPKPVDTTPPPVTTTPPPQQTPPPKQTPPPPVHTPTPTPTPTPKLYNLYVEHRVAGENTLLKSCSESGFAAGAEYTHGIHWYSGYKFSNITVTRAAGNGVNYSQDHTRTNINADPDKSTFGGAFTDHDIYIVVWYVKIPDGQGAKDPNKVIDHPLINGPIDGNSDVEVSEPPMVTERPTWTQPPVVTAPPPKPGNNENIDPPPTDPVPVHSSTVVDPGTGQPTDPGGLPDGGDMDVPT